MNIRNKMLRSAFIVLLLGSTPMAAEPDPIIMVRMLDAPIEEVWSSWTTPQGMQQFFAPEAVVDPRIDGEYSVFFFPDNPPGTRGAEQMRIVAIESPNRLLFTWNSPPFFGPVREQRALVEVSLEEAGQNHTRLTLRHFGWGRGEKWAAIQKYFDGAWRVVLDRLEYSYTNGPIDWNNVPEYLWYDAGPKDL